MWKLLSPSISSVEQDLTDALTYKINKPALYELNPSEIKDIKALYLAYDNHRGRPCNNLKGEGLGEELREIIKNAYDEVQETRRLKDLRDRLKLNPDHCPLCGFGPIQDLDHHLPKSIYKPLAIYPRNLVPSCTTCNKKKYTVATDEPTKQFLHVYLEELPNEIFFIADVILAPPPSGLLVTFRVEKSSSMSDEMAQRLSFQIERLELNVRYPKAINTYLSSLVVSFYDAYGVDNNADRLRDYLVRSAESSEKIFGKNDWRTVLLRGLANCSAFCNGGFRQVVGKPNVGA